MEPPIPRVEAYLLPMRGDNVRVEVRATLKTGTRLYEFVQGEKLPDSLAEEAEYLRKVSSYCLRMAKDLEYVIKKP